MRTTIIAGLTAIALLSPSLSFAQETRSPQGAAEQEHRAQALKSEGLHGCADSGA